MRRTNHAAVITSCIALYAALLFGVASAHVAAQLQTRVEQQPVAILTVISGDVFMRSAAGDFVSAMDGAVLYVGSVLRTSADARALITLFEGSTMELDPASDVTIEDTTARSGSTIAQALGRGWHVVTRLTSADSRYEFKTPAATASVRGIDLELLAADSFPGLPTTLMPTTLFGAPATPTMTVQLVIAAPTTTERASTAAVSPRSASPAGKIRRVITHTLIERALATAGRSRDSDHDDDRGDKD